MEKKTLTDKQTEKNKQKEILTGEDKHILTDVHENRQTRRQRALPNVLTDR